MIDGEFVTDDPDVLLESGRVNQKDVMVGVNKDEGTHVYRYVLLSQLWSAVVKMSVYL